MRKRTVLRAADWLLYRLAEVTGHRIAEGDWPIQRMPLKAVLRNLLSRNSRPIVVDGGAHYGETIGTIMDICPGANIHAFEPNPGAMHRLRAIAEQHQGNVSIYGQAIGSRSGTSQFHIGADDETSSLKAPSDEGLAIFPSEQRVVRILSVPVVTIDDWASNAGVAGIDLLKLDLQGAELDALKGATKMLEKSVGIIWSEVQFLRTYEGCSVVSDVVGFLAERAYALYGIYNIFYDGQGRAVQGDALWLAPVHQDS